MVKLKQVPKKTLVETLKTRGLTCAKLKKLEKRQRDDARRFRQVGFNNIANSEEQTADKIKSLRKQVCLLK